MIIRWGLTVCLLAALCCPAPSRGQVILSQIDTFQDGSTMAWGTNGSQPVNIPTGGPAGANDRYLQVSSGSFGGNVRLLIFNQAQWVGNYVSAGVGRVDMDLNNFTNNPLTIRFGLRSGTGGSGTPGYVSEGFPLPANSGWTHVTFLLDADHMTPINSPTPFATFMTNVLDARLFSAVTPNLIGDVVDGQFGVDNIRSLASVPEPGTWALMIGLFAVGYLYFERKRGRHRAALHQEVGVESGVLSP